MPFELVLRNGGVVDPSQNIDRVTDVAFSGGKVAAIGDGLDAGGAERARRCRPHRHAGPDRFAHPCLLGRDIPRDRRRNVRREERGDDLRRYRQRRTRQFGGISQTCDRAKRDPHPALSACFVRGHLRLSSKVMVGEGHDIRLLAARDCLEVVEANRDLIVGIKVRLGRTASGAAGIVPLDVAEQVADQTGLPMMVHIDEPPPSYEAVVARLRPGDVLTHCFRPFPNSPVNGQGKVKPALIEARQRGVLFDIGHGMGSFSWKTARAMIDNGFAPDTISSDVHALCIDGPAYDQVTMLSKFLALGMSLTDVMAASTVNAAKALNRPDLGTLEPGGVGDASILSLDEGAFQFEDVRGEVVTAGQRLHAQGVVVGGRWRHSN